MKDHTKCHICKTSFINRRGCVAHLQKTHLIKKELYLTYYNEYLKEDGEGVCKNCGNMTKYNFGTGKYNICCSNRCAGLLYNKKLKESGIFKTQSPSSIQKQKNTTLQRYGVANPNSLENIKQKKRNTFLINYGVDNPSKVEDIKIKKRNSGFNYMCILDNNFIDFTNIIKE